MPLFKCTGCHHEWEGTHDATRCDWCGEPGDVIVAETGLEQMLKSMRRAGLDPKYRHPDMGGKSFIRKRRHDPESEA